METIDDTINKLHDINYYLNNINVSHIFDKDLVCLNSMVSSLEKNLKNMTLSNEQKEKINKTIEKDKKLYEHMFSHYWNYVAKTE
uniref:Uncharacterized protein n=1 Tax=Borely moumouvirus TaxID=2712067 RepID=A0A6G6AAY2_9VIRU